MSDTDVFQELTLKVRNSHLSHALLLELQDECRINANAADFSRLELHTNPFLEKQLQLLIECVDDLQQESHKMQQHERNLYRHGLEFVRQQLATTEYTWCLVVWWVRRAT